MHLVQTLVAYFQALDDLHFDLGELDVLDLKQEGEGEASLAVTARAQTPKVPRENARKKGPQQRLKLHQQHETCTEKLLTQAAAYPAGLFLALQQAT